MISWIQGQITPLIGAGLPTASDPAPCNGLGVQLPDFNAPEYVQNFQCTQAFTSICQTSSAKYIGRSDQAASVVLQQVTNAAKREKITSTGVLIRTVSNSVPQQRFAVAAGCVDETEHHGHLESAASCMWVTS